MRSSHQDVQGVRLSFLLEPKTDTAEVKPLAQHPRAWIGAGGLAPGPIHIARTHPHNPAPLAPLGLPPPASHLALKPEHLPSRSVLPISVCQDSDTNSVGRTSQNPLLPCGRRAGSASPAPLGARLSVVGPGAPCPPILVARSWAAAASVLLSGPCRPGRQAFTEDLVRGPCLHETQHRALQVPTPSPGCPSPRLQLVQLTPLPHLHLDGQ